MHNSRHSTSSSIESESSQASTVALSVKSEKRRRGRPRGKPVPLNMEERRQRNAQYERERREEMAVVMKMLAATMGEEYANVPNSHLLAAVVHKLQRRRHEPPEDIESIKKVNASLEAQIAEVSARLGTFKEDSNSSSSTSSGVKAEEINSTYFDASENQAVMPYPQPVKTEQTVTDDYWTMAPGTSSGSTSSLEMSVPQFEANVFCPKPENNNLLVTESTVFDSAEHRENLDDLSPDDAENIFGFDIPLPSLMQESDVMDIFANMM